MVTAKEARETALMADQEKVMQERKLERDHQAEITETVDGCIKQEIAKMDKLIEKATRKGEFQTSYHADDNEVERVLIGRMAAHYTKDDYKVRRESYTVDHGDSAAPCVCDELRLTISW